jgi:hypothetical protein
MSIRVVSHGRIAAEGLADVETTVSEILEVRLASGWLPRESALKDGDRVVGHAACVVTSKSE